MSWQKVVNFQLSTLKDMSLLLGYNDGVDDLAGAVEQAEGHAFRGDFHVHRSDGSWPFVPTEGDLVGVVCQRFERLLAAFVVA